MRDKRTSKSRTSSLRNDTESIVYLFQPFRFILTLTPSVLLTVTKFVFDFAAFVSLFEFTAHLVCRLCGKFNVVYVFALVTSLLVSWLGSLTTNHEVPCSIPGSTMGKIPVVNMVWVVSRFSLKASPGISSSCISALASSGQRSRASWASQPQKSATLSPQPGGKPRNS